MLDAAWAVNWGEVRHSESSRRWVMTRVVEEEDATYGCLKLWELFVEMTACSELRACLCWSVLPYE